MIAINELDRFQLYVPIPSIHSISKGMVTDPFLKEISESYP